MTMFREKLGKEFIYFDGAMGTLLQEAGLRSGECPELWNVERADVLIDIHQRYLRAGSNVVTTNTFGANKIKLESDKYSLEQIVTAAVNNAQNAIELMGCEAGRYVALDIGPTGKLLAPFGDLDFEEAYESFAEVVRFGAKAGADLICIETMSDTYEMKAAILAAKENCDLPIIATFTFDETAKLLTGADIKATVALLEGLRVDAYGINCGLGPKQMLPIIKEMSRYASLPLVVQANAGLPHQKDGVTVYDITPEEFAKDMAQLVECGVTTVGGCCGTNPQYISKLIDECKKRKPIIIERKDTTLVSAYGAGVEIGAVPCIIGERLNPTGKKKMQQALKDEQYEVLLKEGLLEQEAGADILDINVGVPGIDEEKVLQNMVLELQKVISLPLQLDTANEKAMEAALRIYNGKAILNSVNGKQESMDKVFPLVKKYGGVVIGLTLDESGIPDNANERIAIAERIITEAKKYGIDKKDILIDALAMTISSNPNSANVTLETIRRLKEELGVRTVLGVSNISFGLPRREIVNSYYYALALAAGLDAGIINPLDAKMMEAYNSYLALSAQDDNCGRYIANYGELVSTTKTDEATIATASKITLGQAVEKGLKDEAIILCKEELITTKPLDIIETSLIPALDKVGKGFEVGSIFLPQLLMSAEAAKAVFGIINESMPAGTTTGESANKIILATVKGDIHDIGKNIVKVLLENYGYKVIDLGKDVSSEIILKTIQQEDVKLVGLSALMTTTVDNMRQTIEVIKNEYPQIKVMVGGAVLTQGYADMIGADYYGNNAMEAVSVAKKVF